MALHFESFVAKSERKHSIALYPKCCFHILCRHDIIKIGIVVARPCIIHPSGILYCAIKVGNIYRPTKHQVLKQVSHAGQLGRFVASTHIIHYVKCHHCSGTIVVMHYPQPIVEGEC